MSIKEILTQIVAVLIVLGSCVVLPILIAWLGWTHMQDPFIVGLIFKDMIITMYLCLLYWLLTS